MPIHKLHKKKTNNNKKQTNKTKQTNDLTKKRPKKN